MELRVTFCISLMVFLCGRLVAGDRQYVMYNISTYAGEPTTLTCVTDDHSIDMNWSWLEGMVPIYRANDAPYISRYIYDFNVIYNSTSSLYNRIYLNTSTLSLSINSTQIADEGNYTCRTNAGAAYTHLQVYVKIEEDSATTSSEIAQYIERGSTVSRTVSLDRVRPQTTSFTCTYGHDLVSGDVTSVDNGDGTFSESVDIEVTIQDNGGEPLICDVMSVATNGRRVVILLQMVNAGYGPSGKPSITNDSSNLICDLGDNNDGSPSNNYRYRWTKDDDDYQHNVATPRIDLLEVGPAQLPGVYYCIIGNEFGRTMISDGFNFTKTEKQLADELVSSNNLEGSESNQLPAVLGSGFAVLFVAAVMVVVSIIVYRRFKTRKESNAEYDYPNVVSLVNSNPSNYDDGRATFNESNNPPAVYVNQPLPLPPANGDKEASIDPQIIANPSNYDDGRSTLNESNIPPAVYVNQPSPQEPRSEDEGAPKDPQYINMHGMNLVESSNYAHLTAQHSGNQPPVPNEYESMEMHQDSGRSTT